MKVAWPVNSSLPIRVMTNQWPILTMTGCRLHVFTHVSQIPTHASQGAGHRADSLTPLTWDRAQAEWPIGLGLCPIYSPETTGDNPPIYVWINIYTPYHEENCPCAFQILPRHQRPTIFECGFEVRYMDIAGSRGILGLGLHYSFTIGKWYKWKCRSNAFYE